MRCKVRGQRSEVRGQKSEVIREVELGEGFRGLQTRSQTSAGRRQRSEVRGRRLVLGLTCKSLPELIIMYRGGGDEQMSPIVFDISNDVLLALKVSADDAGTARDQTSEVPPPLKLRQTGRVQRSPVLLRRSLQMNCQSTIAN